MASPSGSVPVTTTMAVSGSRVLRDLEREPGTAPICALRPGAASLLMTHCDTGRPGRAPSPASRRRDQSFLMPLRYRAPDATWPRGLRAAALPVERFAAGSDDAARLGFAACRIGAGPFGARTAAPSTLFRLPARRSHTASALPGSLRRDGAPAAHRPRGLAVRPGSRAISPGGSAGHMHGADGCPCLECLPRADWASAAPASSPERKAASQIRSRHRSTASRVRPSRSSAS